MFGFKPKIEAEWIEPPEFRRARADYERDRPIDLRKRAVIALGAMGAFTGLAFHFMDELIKHPRQAAAFAGLALAVGILYLPLRGYLLANFPAKIQLNKTHIERRAALGLEQEKWEIKEIKSFEFTTARHCELLLLEMQDGTRAFFGIPHASRANIQNNLPIAFKNSRP